MKGSTVKHSKNAEKTTIVASSRGAFIWARSQEQAP
jgi:hypothetical protein